jgi:hypothetical protein
MECVGELRPLIHSKGLLNNVTAKYYKSNLEEI